MTNFPPLKLQDACEFVRGHRNLNWYYIIYDANGNRRHFNAMKRDNWIYEEVAEHCKTEVIDKWHASKEIVSIPQF
ncbi:hypothetical protein NIES4071_108280 (plasmid) [Calothrix sp. NIES-4071]|nr:hypothetical protein NIES4071_108280 [Calothrix sp. NIES-4071]BAZ64868.1 hypothetical protein NIES4105_106010 [Calothrix sp. NIES-4105]